MNLRKHIYFTLNTLRGFRYPQIYRDLIKEEKSVLTSEVTQKLLTKILRHCQKSVPYYTNLMSEIGKEELLKQNPEIYLSKLPILTKDIIRKNFEELKSLDLEKRNWYFNTSGGSTGEPIRFIQDQEYFDQSQAIKLLYSYLAGREIGEPQVKLWGSERDILEATRNWRAIFSSFFSNTTYINAYQMSPQRMAAYIRLINQKSPKQILAYAIAIYELAKFAESEQLQITPPNAIITSAENLHPWMRETIERVFQCQVFNRYGSREVGDIACERPGFEGFWIAPWANYVEIVDDHNNPLPPGVEGNILITSLSNFAMPLIRYKIGDRGSVSANHSSGQIFEKISGRTTDMFKTQDGTLANGGYFEGLMYFKDWVKNYQIIQKSYSEILVKIVLFTPNYPVADLDDFVEKTKILMGEDCIVNFEFVDEIKTTPSGKYRYVISEVS
ncbi:hypothetical protein [Anabaena sp. UHCC 0451]|uniref:hypothetical protein n=1 Tax=Anabaena sp. UHCC 0451 TaxID=2055235 RepID=UPI002B1EBB04|nr:hypothetical protein [Anabaena sp. UHCC 0451]MEA5579045.1 hypothetical protein [Anabaena sp. UHCC 0451]